jgi:negative regulator of sigma E activity
MNQDLIETQCTYGSYLLKGTCHVHLEKTQFARFNVSQESAEKRYVRFKQFHKNLCKHGYVQCLVLHQMLQHIHWRQSWYVQIMSQCTSYPEHGILQNRRLVYSTSFPVGRFGFPSYVEREYSDFLAICCKPEGRGFDSR